MRLARLLAPVYGWFTEKFDTLDLKEGTARQVGSLRSAHFFGTLEL
jgi:hypothetical protein